MFKPSNVKLREPKFLAAVLTKDNYPKFLQFIQEHIRSDSYKINTFSVRHQTPLSITTDEGFKIEVGQILVVDELSQFEVHTRESFYEKYEFLEKFENFS